MSESVNFKVYDLLGIGSVGEIDRQVREPHKEAEDNRNQIGLERARQRTPALDRLGFAQTPTRNGRSSLGRREIRQMINELLYLYTTITTNTDSIHN